jgi:hypothetical protein
MFSTHYAPLSPISSPFPSARLHWRPLVPCAGSEPAPRWIKNSPRKRTRITQIGRIFTDFPIRANPRHPCNPCSTSASLFVDAPSRGVTLGAFICGSFFAEAPSNDRCARLPPEHLPKFDVFVNLYDGAHASLLRLPRAKIRRASMVVA